MIKWKKLLIAILIPLAVGGISALLTSSNMKMFELIDKPPLSPPAWLFPVAWTILYILMGISSYIIYENKYGFNEEISKKWLTIYGVQLVFNFFWSIIFFNLKYYLLAFIWLLIMWGLIIYLVVNARKINKTASNLLIPYLLWTTFAGYLNIGIAILN